MPQQNRLCRSTRNQIIAGVCAGLAEHFDTDPALVRIIFVVLVFAGGSGILLYLLLWLVLPEDQAVERGRAQPLHSSAYHGVHRPTTLDDHVADLRARMQSSHNHAHGFLGLIVTMLGVFILLNSAYPQVTLNQIVGIVVILFGLVLMFRRHDGQR